MRLFKADPKTGYVTEINTDGNYRPPGWSLTKEAAEIKGKRKQKKHGQTTNNFKRQRFSRNERKPTYY